MWKSYLNMVILRFVPPTPFSFLNVLKNGQSIFCYRTRRDESNDIKIDKIRLDWSEIQNPEN